MNLYKIILPLVMVALAAIALLVAASLITPTWLTVNTPDRTDQKGIYWTCFSTPTQTQSLCSDRTFTDNPCNGNTVSGNDYKMRFTVIRVLLLIGMGLATFGVFLIIIPLVTTRYRTKILILLFLIILFTFITLLCALLVYFFTEYLFAYCGSGPCTGLAASCSTSISTGYILAIIAAGLALLLLFPIGMLCCIPLYHIEKKGSMRAAPEDIHDERHVEGQYMRGVLDAEYVTKRSNLHQIASRESFRRANPLLSSPRVVDSIAIDPHTITAEQAAALPFATTTTKVSPIAPGLLPNRANAPSVRRVISEPYDTERIPAFITKSPLPVRNEDPNAVSVTDKEWFFDRESGLYWSQEQEVFYDDFSGHFYDPHIAKWFDPSTSEWYELE